MSLEPGVMAESKDVLKNQNEGPARDTGATRSAPRDPEWNHLTHRLARD